MLPKLQHEEESETQDSTNDPEIGQDQTTVSTMNKSWECVIQKSGDIISGWAASEISYHQGQILPMSVLAKTLPKYLEHGTIILQH